MYSVRNTEHSLLYGIAKSINHTRQLNVAALFHYDQLADMAGDFAFPVVTLMTVTAANATDLATSITLANQLKKVYNRHRVDGPDVYLCGCHKTADATNATTAADATDLATVQTLLNDIKVRFNAHLTQANVHSTNDGTNTVATANATDQATSNALAIALKSALNAHMASAPAGHGVRILAA